MTNPNPTPSATTSKVCLLILSTIFLSACSAKSDIAYYKIVVLPTSVSPSEGGIELCVHNYARTGQDWWYDFDSAMHCNTKERTCFLSRVECEVGEKLTPYAQMLIDVERENEKNAKEELDIIQARINKLNDLRNLTIQR